MNKEQLTAEIKTAVNVLNALVKEANEMGLIVEVWQQHRSKTIHLEIFETNKP